MHIESNGKFCFDKYDQQAPFSNFFPGLGGKSGIPLWLFYVNRGQAVSSFGVQSKDQAFLEFNPANKAYWMTDHTGFRTFIKSDDWEELYQPFSPWHNSSEVNRKMIVDMNVLVIQESNHRFGLKTEIEYFTVPNEPFAALIRKVTLKNIGWTPKKLEIIDGLPSVVPYGSNNAALKEISRTNEAWMQVENLENDAPFYRMRASSDDSPEVSQIKAGHFAFGFMSNADKNGLAAAIVDPKLVFGEDTAFINPSLFQTNSVNVLAQKHQVTGGKTPSAFFAYAFDLGVDQSLSFYEVFGHCQNIADIQWIQEKLTTPNVLRSKKEEAERLAVSISEPIKTKTSNRVFDQYCAQTFLDNVLRGGTPVSFPQTDKIFHIFGRKHGDLERDYNEFVLTPEPFSQGNANYRDVNQNRRNDIFFYPEIGTYNIHTFVDLIQLDGYNPLVLRNVVFSLEEEKIVQLASIFDLPKEVDSFIRQPFSPGGLVQKINNENLTNSVAIIREILNVSEQHTISEHGEGYWTDHWAYILDQIESYLAIFPDKTLEIILKESNYRFIDSAHLVQSRAKRYVLANGKPMQLNAVKLNKEKEKQRQKRPVVDQWVRHDYGKGAVYETSLYSKLLMLSLIKFATLDPEGMGIEMEAGKPGWYDALNGLPGIFGSSMAESYELKRLITFLKEVAEFYPMEEIKLPIEISKLLDQIKIAVSNKKDHAQFDFWDELTHARENYFAEVYKGISGEEKTYALLELQSLIDLLLEWLNIGIEQAVGLTKGLPPTYFYYQPKEYEVVEDSFDQEERQRIKIKGFEQNTLPLFLEGFVRYLKILENDLEKTELHQKLKSSDLFDPVLKMYKVNASLADCSYDIGRARAFTPGWLENESIWLHMLYKYLLSMLDAGLYKEFLEEIPNNLIPFLNPNTYGRSILENSSFIVSSAHPEKELHGQGFVARLSGATAEFLTIWLRMMVGKNPFTIKNGQLSFSVSPTIPKDLFDKSDSIEFVFLNSCSFKYINSTGKDLLPTTHRPQQWVIIENNGHRSIIEGAVLESEWAEKLRSGNLKSIEVHF